MLRSRDAWPRVRSTGKLAGRCNSWMIWSNIIGRAARLDWALPFLRRVLKC